MSKNKHKRVASFHRTKIINDIDYRLSKYALPEHFGFFQEISKAFYHIRAQKESLDSVASHIETLALGSSHIKYAFNPALYSKKSFCFGTDSQDLFHSAKIYDIYNERLNSLRTLIIGISVFSVGFDVVKTKRRYISDIFQYIFNYKRKGYQPLSHNWKLLRKLNKLKIKIRHHYGHFIASPNHKICEHFHKRLMSQIKENQRYPKQTDFLISIINKASKSNVSIYLLIPPLTKYAKYLAPQYNSLFHDIICFSEKYNVPLINFYDSESFQSEDFIDFDHLNRSGAAKFTTLLKNEVEKIEKNKTNKTETIPALLP